jgi:methionine-rich copper-binding protein CopC
MAAMRALLRHVLPVLVGALALAPSAVLAHSNSVDSNPADDSTIVALPKVATVTFNERVSTAALALTGPDGKVRELRPRVEGAVVSATLPDEKLRGAYVLAYRVVSADGHPVTGEIEFRVATREAGLRSDTSSAPADPTPPGFPVGVVIGGAVIVLGAALSLLRASRK